MCDNKHTNQITDMSTLQFVIRKLCNFVLRSMQSNAADISEMRFATGHRPNKKALDLYKFAFCRPTSYFT